MKLHHFAVRWHCNKTSLKCLVTKGLESYYPAKLTNAWYK